MSGRLDFRNFSEVFGNGDTLPYDAHVNRDIESKRKSLGGVLFVDRVFTALGISKGECTPRQGRWQAQRTQHTNNSLPTL